MELLGYLGAFFVGLTMGLLGGGGSVLSIPILVYLFSVEAVLATSYSLFIVGFTSLIGSFQKFLGGLINFRIAFLFGIPSLVFVYIARVFILPWMPDLLFSLGGWTCTKSIFILVFFAILMMMASFSMIANSNQQLNEAEQPLQYNPVILVLLGAIYGLLTGFVGAGGGFICIPIFVILVGLSMKVAVGTSLFVILIKSIVGFLGDLQTEMLIDWGFLGKFTVIAVLGILIGTWWSKRLKNRRLKRMFGWFILILALFILIKEVFLVN